MHVDKNRAVLEACHMSSSKPSQGLGRASAYYAYIKQVNKHVEDIMSKGNIKARVPESLEG